jgi:anti-anti-sigma regulatory factor
LLEARLTGGDLMLRISPLHSNGGAVTLKLEGRVIGPWVEELRRSCERALATGAAPTLDLSDVSFIDRSGVELFRNLRNRQVLLLNCSRFVAEQLK